MGTACAGDVDAPSLSGSPTTSTTSTTSSLVPSTTLSPTTTLPPTTTTPPATPIHFADGEAVRIVATGDSVTVQWLPHLSNLLGPAADVVRRAHGGTALCDWFERQGDDLGLEHLADWQPHVFVLDHGGNSLTNCMGGAEGDAYHEKNRQDLDYLMGLAEEFGARVLLIAQPIGRNGGRAGTHELYETAPDDYADGTVRFVSTWPVLSPDGEFLQEAPCNDTEPGCVDGTGLLRSPPPGGHLEPLGSWRYASVVAEALDALGWLPEGALSR